MGESDERLDAAIREALAEERTVPPGEHPDPEELLACHRRELDEEEAERVREHLAACAACTDVILDFAAFPHLEPTAEEDRLTPAELRHDREALEARIGSDRRSWWRRSEYAALPAAAVFLLAALGLWAWQLRGNVAELEQRVAELEEPRGNVDLVTLASLSETERGEQEVPTVDLAEDGSVLLTFSWPTDDFVRYTLDLRTAEDEVPVRDLELEVRPERGFVVSLPRDLFQPGENVLELYGHDGGERVLLARYPVVAEA